MADLPAISQQVRAWRLDRGLTQAELQMRSGLAHNAISRIETGEVQPRLETIERLAQSLDISVEQLQFRQPSSFQPVTNDNDLAGLINRLQQLPSGKREMALRMIVAILDSLEES